MITNEQLEELRSKYKRVARIVAKAKPGDEPMWEVVIRKPSRGEYSRCKTQIHDPERAPVAYDALFRQICVSPLAGDAIDALLEDFPGIPEACIEAIHELAGVTAGKQ